MSGDSRPRPDVVAFYRAMLPAESRANHTFDVDDRFAPPGKPSRTDLGRYCDWILHLRRSVSLPIDRETGFPLGVDPASVILPIGWDLADDRWLTLTGTRGHAAGITHHTVVVVDLDDPHARLALVTVAALIAQHDLHPHHGRIPALAHDPMEDT